MKVWKDFEDYSLFDSGTLEGYLFRKDLAATRKRAAADSEFRRAYLAEHAIRPATSAGFKVSRYRSGEMTGAFFTAGRTGKQILTTRSGPLVTRQFTRAARVKIRRSVECSETFLRYFCTLTFAPAALHPWHVNEDGTVRHDYAKWKLKKFLDACYRQQRRLGRVLSYLWVAELQHNGNIHFHILLDQFFPIKYLSKIWAQANNSVDIQRVNNPLHAVRYMRKYITKDETSEIQGNRYFISQQLREAMKPLNDKLIKINSSSHERPLQLFSEIREFIQACKQDIQARGGIVLDFGFNIPVPRSPARYTCKQTGQPRISPGVDPQLHKQLYTSLYDLTSQLPF